MELALSARLTKLEALQVMNGGSPGGPNSAISSGSKGHGNTAVVGCGTDVWEGTGMTQA